MGIYFAREKISTEEMKRKRNSDSEFFGTFRRTVWKKYFSPLQRISALLSILRDFEDSSWKMPTRKIIILRAYVFASASSVERWYG